MQAAAEGAVREQLAKVLTSPEFQNSERLCRFLRFIVDAKLRGEQDQVKEYLIGNKVFDRDGSYDPRLDPIVRVEARRLRKKLESYYAGPGSADAIRFELPKGAYVLEIHELAAIQVDPITVAPARLNWWKAGAAAALICGVCLAAAMYFWPRSTLAEPVVAILPARWIWIGNDFPDVSHDEDLAERMGASLANHREIRIVSWPSIQQFRGTGKNTRQLAAEFKVTLMILVAVRVESDGFRVTVYLIDPVRDRKLSVSDQRSVALDTPAEREKAAAQLTENSLRALKTAP